jgi:hypothetical protein
MKRQTVDLIGETVINTWLSDPFGLGIVNIQGNCTFNAETPVKWKDYGRLGV